MSHAYDEVEFIKSKIRKHNNSETITPQSKVIKNNKTKNYIDSE